MPDLNSSACYSEAERDDLVLMVTAFTSWDHLVDAMKGGYVPTLTTERLRGLRRGSKAYRLAVQGNAVREALATIIRANGFRAWTDSDLLIAYADGMI